MEKFSNKKPTNKEFIEMASEAMRNSELEGEAAIDFLIEEVNNSRIDIGDALKEAQKTGHAVFLRDLKELYNKRGFDSSDIDSIN